MSHIPLVEDNAVRLAVSRARGVGFKADQGKPDWTLVPWDGLERVVRVLEFGAKKYDRDNWRLVPDLQNRYRAAALRHLVADLAGEAHDPESSEDHLAHAACCLLFVLANRWGVK